MSERLTDEQVRRLIAIESADATSPREVGIVNVLRELLDARQRIADLEADNARLRGELDDAKFVIDWQNELNAEAHADE